VAMAQLEQLTQQTAANSEESAAASEELSAQAETSMAVVGNLESLVGHHPARADRTVAASSGLARAVPAKRAA